MNNEEAIDRFEQTHAQIEKMVWIAGALEMPWDFEDMLGDMTKDDWKHALPEIYNNEYFDEYFEDNNMVQGLIDSNKFGILAQISVAQCYNFNLNDDGKPIAWGINSGIRRNEYFYGETLEQILEQAENFSKEWFDIDLKKFKDSQ